MPRPARQRVERTARDRIGEQVRRASDRSSAPAPAPPSATRRARADRRQPPRRSRAASRPAACACGRRSAVATVARKRSGSMSSRPASFMTYWSRTRSFGCSTIIAAARSAACARPSSVDEIGRARAGARCGTRGTASRPSPRSTNASRIVAPHVGGIAAGREIGDLELHLEALLPLVAASRPRPGRRRRRRTRA